MMYIMNQAPITWRVLMFKTTEWTLKLLRYTLDIQRRGCHHRFVLFLLQHARANQIPSEAGYFIFIVTYSSKLRFLKTEADEAYVAR